MYSASTPPIFSIERAILSPRFKVFGPLKCTLRDESGIETAVVCCMLSPDEGARKGITLQKNVIQPRHSQESELKNLGQRSGLLRHLLFLYFEKQGINRQSCLEVVESNLPVFMIVAEIFADSLIRYDGLSSSNPISSGIGNVKTYNAPFFCFIRL